MYRESIHLSLRCHDSGWVSSLVELGLYPQPGSCSSIAYQVDNRLEGTQRLASPVPRDVAEQAVFNLVPLARARWEVTDSDPQIPFVGELLQLVLPSARAISIASPAHYNVNPGR